MKGFCEIRDQKLWYFGGGRDNNKAIPKRLNERFCVVTLFIIGAYSLQNILKFQDLAQYKLGNILKYPVILLESLVREQVVSHMLQKADFALIPASISIPVFSVFLP